MKIASLEDPFPRGTIMGKQVTGPRLSEAEHFKRCLLCAGFIDLRDRAWIDGHQQPLPHPAKKQGAIDRFHFLRGPGLLRPIN